MSAQTWSSSTPARPEPVSSWWHSLRWRVAAASAGVSLLAVVGIGLLVLAEVSDSAREKVRADSVTLLRAGTAELSFARLGASYSLDDKELPRVLVAALRGDQITTYDDGRAMWAARHVPGGKVLSTRLPNAPIESQVAHVRTYTATTAAAVVVVTWVLSLLVASRLTRRLRAAAESVRRLPDGASSHLGAGGADEVAVLTAAIDAATAALAARLEQARAFSADLAHELRTPLTALVSNAELLDDSTESTRVRGAVQRLRLLVEDLLSLAHLEAPHEESLLQELDLADSVSGVLLGLAHEHEVTFTVDGSASVLGDRRHLERALTNLVRNAHKHGGGPIEVTVSGASVEVRDHGAGYPASVLRDGPHRFRAVGAAAGTGLGLTIALRDVEAMHGLLRLANAATGGAVATIVLSQGAED